jgi:hypothetical protein
MANRYKEIVTLEDRLTAATFDPSCRPQFYRWLPTSYVYAGINPSVAHPDFTTVRRAGKEYIAVYTSEEMLPPKCRTARIKFGEFLEILDGRGVSLNPGQPVTKDFSREELLSIKKGELSNPGLFERGVTSASELEAPLRSKNLWKPMSSLLKNHPEVNRAWSADLKNNQRGKASMGAWFGLSASSRSSTSDALRECTVLLTTLDAPPPVFRVEFVQNPPRVSSCFYQNEREGSGK